MTEIDKTLAQALGKEVEEALNAVAERHGLQVQVRGGTYDSTLFKPKVEFTTLDAAEREFARYASLFGLKPDDFNAEFTSQGRLFKVSGVAPRSTKRPILAIEVTTGRTFKFTETGVLKGLGRA